MHEIQRSNDFEAPESTATMGNYRRRRPRRMRPPTGRRTRAPKPEPSEPLTWGKLNNFFTEFPKRISSVILGLFTKSRTGPSKHDKVMFPRRIETFETTTIKSPWNLQSTAPTITRRQAMGRFYVLHCLLSAKIPFVVWGLEALACNFVPTHFRDPLELLVPREYLEEAAKVIENDKYSFYRRIEKFDHVDDYTFPREVSALVRRNLMKANAGITHGFAQTKKLSAHLGFRGILSNIRFPTFFGMLNAIYTTIDCRCVDGDDNLVRTQLEEQAEALIIWRIRRDKSAEIYHSIEDFPEDLLSIRNGLYPRNREYFDSRYLAAEIIKPANRL
ncbi:hypothetical protein TWF506_004055 [Arthrobotrys conoides]|uniref:Uncharacterized protein n=1 Tax=Arthrobotrys conoides TaxID=74498 RepID=A0AAN8N1F0_9PEZI